MDRRTKIAIGSISLWILGLVVINRILALSGSLYPKLDANTPNPYYSQRLNDFMIPVILGWSAVCWFIWYLLDRVSKGKEQ